MDWNASFFHKMLSFVLTLIRNCLEAPFLASIRATSLELPQHLFLCGTYLFFQEKGYMCMVLRGFFYIYLIKQCDPLLFMNSFCWEWNKSCLCRERSSRDEKKAKPSFWVFPECFRSVYSKNIYWWLSGLETIPGKEGGKIKIWDLTISYVQMCQLCIKNL